MKLTGALNIDLLHIYPRRAAKAFCIDMLLYCEAKDFLSVSLTLASLLPPLAAFHEEEGLYCSLQQQQQRCASPQPWRCTFSALPSPKESLRK